MISPIKLRKVWLIITIFIVICFTFISCENKTEDLVIPEGEVVLAIEQEENIKGIITALSQGGIRYNFSGLNEISPEHLEGYLQIRSSAFFSENDVRVGFNPLSPLEGWLDSAQIYQILSHDFRIDNLPFETTNSNNLAFVIQLGVLNKGWYDLKLTGDKNLIYAVATFEYWPDRRTIESKGLSIENEARIYQDATLCF